ncbi:sigma-70 family RNA polymerase sigma factor [Specibacter cremeus]|uniref:sigma-70 family RNA polymerase sigma factor n=1 Tax=Specibacter cremeus TaxID=1629051 RepID=UPI0023E8B7E1|nr:sigma-70 family RNA polymerase sigma factor [Specibacter cremeus]
MKEPGTRDAEVQDAMRALHRDYAGVLWRFVVRLTRDDALAEDIVQETLVRAWRHPAVLSRPAPALRAWLFTVARNLVIDESRSARHRHERGAAEVPEAAMPDELDRALDAWLIEDALAALSVEHRDVIVRAYYGGQGAAAIADDLDIPAGTVKSRLHYGLRALRLALEERGVSQS